MMHTDSLIKRVEEYCIQRQLLSPDQTIIIGLSGGPDSVFLMHVLCTLRTHYNLHLIAAHLDHGWRTNSHEDVEFCKQLSTSMQVDFVHAHATDLKTPKKSGSLEEQGRSLRRAFFAQLAKEKSAHGPALIALGHHADDQQETFFIRLMRGAGVTGLAGIKPRDGMIIHPLLCCSKKEIINFLTTETIPYLTDPTNTDDQFLRNRIRSSVLPALRACDNRFDSSLARTMDRLREADDYLTRTAQTLFLALSSHHNGVLSISIPKLLELHPYMQKQVILQWLIAAHVPFTPSTSFFKEIIRFLQNTRSNKHTFYTRWSMSKQADLATITFCA
jgi:tRNA(Ile)-lysidine synthase